jgi:2-succinyl-5-enolpyruvyl-6-hydroxy-3-cyclohexene-1-carboxylate synthase
MTQAQLIQQTLSTLVHFGVREVCVAAGARNAPLVASLLASQGLKVWNFFEERSAAFFALGRIMADRQLRSRS